MRATGDFDVKLQPVDTFSKGTEGINIGRMAIEKNFKGDLAARSRGEMLSVMTPVEGSGGYVAVEQVSGTLRGMNGTFALQHFGVMRRGLNRLVLEVVPDSGTGRLVGLSGKMTITVENGRHTYKLDYSLTE